MAISFVCGCGKNLRARDELAGKKTKCPQCESVVAIPRPESVPPFEDQEYTPEPLQPGSPRLSVSTYHPAPQSDQDQGPDRPVAPTSKKVKPKAKAHSGGDGSLLEYSYLLLLFALIPLVISLLGKDANDNLIERITRTIAKAPPEEQLRIKNMLARDDVSLDDAIAAMPSGKLDGAHLARNTVVHWVYAAIAATAFLLLLGIVFSVERAHPMHLLGIGAFTGTVGIIFLFAVQACSSFRLGGIRGRGVVVIILLILAFIGWSYNSAEDPDSNFLLSALGFTFGVGLCEEFTKAIPLFFYFKRQSVMGWRGACLWGLASGIGFGVSEGIMYSSRHYNGFGGADIYLVRFVSCVALHAMWSASVGIAIARNVDAYEEVGDGAAFGLFMLRVMAVPMVLHGFYDTLLKTDHNVWALVVALLSFAWFAWHIELARGSHPDAGRPHTGKKKYSY